MSLTFAPLILYSLFFVVLRKLIPLILYGVHRILTIFAAPFFPPRCQRNPYSLPLEYPIICISRFRIRMKLISEDFLRFFSENFKYIYSCLISKKVKSCGSRIFLQGSSGLIMLVHINKG